MKLAIEDVFVGLPAGLRRDLLDSFNEVVRNYREHRWEPSELNGGKLCEAVYTVITGYIDGQYEPRAVKPANMLDSCRALERNGQVPRSLRIQIPRILIALYEIRNNRGVGHAGGDVDPNPMDSMLVLYMSKWVLAELIRVLHIVTNEEATQLVDSLIERETPLVWSDGIVKRVLAAKLTRREQVLALLLPESGEVSESDLMVWLEVTERARLRRDVLRPMHKCRFIDFNESRQTVRLLPPGVEAAEKLIASTRSTAQ